MRCRILCVLLVCLAGSPARATDFKAGALIIPMDTDYQDSGMLEAFGLLYQLLKADVPVHWVIKAKKKVGDVDFTVSAKDLKTGAAVSSHGYRGGPFVVADDKAAAAKTVISAWQSKHASTTVHVAEQGFSGRTGRLLTAAPTIAVIADGNEDIAYDYLNAAAIPDRQGNVWSKTSPDVLSIAEVAGPTTTKHNDGKLFRASGQPAFCQIMTMHWGVNQVVDEVVAEYRAFLSFPTHMMAECQGVNAIENHKNGRFLTPNGFLIDNNVKDTGPFEYLNGETPFGQMDGTYNLVGGSERAYTLPTGDKFYDQNVVMIKDAATTLGTRSIWMTGYIDGKCVISDDDVSGKTCASGVGKISYLGGHRYDVKLPISTNPSTQGARLFLNSLFEASCTTNAGQPSITLTLTGPSWTGDGKVAYTLTYANGGPGPALDLVLTDKLPAGATYVSSTGGGSASGGVVTWKLGDVAAKASGSMTLSVSLSKHGTYTNSASGAFVVGINSRSAASNAVVTVYSATPPGDGGGAAGDGQPGGGDDGCGCRLGAPAAGSAIAPLLTPLWIGWRRRRRPRR